MEDEVAYQRLSDNDYEEATVTATRRKSRGNTHTKQERKKRKERAHVKTERKEKNKRKGWFS